MLTRTFLQYILNNKEISGYVTLKILQYRK
jgi:hypothetical protein